MSTKPLNNLGYYGKIPAHGDFVSKALPRSFIEPWDRWLQEAIFASQQQLGELWLDNYLTSPIYDFVLSPGICGANTWLGVLMPSVDKIGRYFPLTVAMMLDDANPFNAIQLNQHFAVLEQLALICLQENATVEQLNDAIAQLQLDTITDAISTPTTMTQLFGQEWSSAWQQPLNSIKSLPELFPAMLDNVLKDRCFAYSLWWSEGSDKVSPSFLFTDGLPGFDKLSAMFDGQWQHWGWQTRRYQK